MPQPPSRFNFGADIFGDLDLIPAALARGVEEAEAARVITAAAPLPKPTHVRVPQPVKTYAELAESEADDYTVRSALRRSLRSGWSRSQLLSTPCGGSQAHHALRSPLLLMGFDGDRPIARSTIMTG